MYTRAALTERQALRAELGISTTYSPQARTFIVTSAFGTIEPVDNFSQADTVINAHLDAVQAARATLASLMTEPAPAAPKTKSKGCTCPQCPPHHYQTPDGIYYCKAGREHIAYDNGVYVTAGPNKDLLQIQDALKNHRHTSITVGARERAA